MDNFFNDMLAALVRCAAAEAVWHAHLYHARLGSSYLLSHSQLMVELDHYYILFLRSRSFPVCCCYSEGTSSCGHLLHLRSCSCQWHIQNIWRTPSFSSAKAGSTYQNALPCDLGVALTAEVQKFRTNTTTQRQLASSRHENRISSFTLAVGSRSTEHRTSSKKSGPGASVS